VTDDDHRLAADLAALTGERLLRVRREHGFGDPATLRDAGDAAAHELIMAELARLRPDDAVLSEHGESDNQRLGADRVWIVDPLDGTREFAEEGREDWAVHIALLEYGELVAGAVALPPRHRVLSTIDVTAPQVATQQLRIAVSRTRPPEVATSAADLLGATLVPMGSAGVKIAAVVLGDADAYLHGGGQYEWDSAAPVAVARAAGLHTSRLDGTPLRYNQPNPWLPDLLVCRPELADRLLAAVHQGRS
jgi:3'(2'), 5'-bisphosphate nucleotidase